MCLLHSLGEYKGSGGEQGLWVRTGSVASRSQCKVYNIVQSAEQNWACNNAQALNRGRHSTGALQGRQSNAGAVGTKKMGSGSTAHSSAAACKQQPLKYSSI